MTLLTDLAPIPAILDRPHGLLEAPRFGPDEEVVYSDALAGGLWACAHDGVVRELLPKRRGIGGAVAHADGGWVISGRTIVHLLADGSQRELLDDGDGSDGDDEDVGTSRGGEIGWAGGGEIGWSGGGAGRWSRGGEVCGFNDLGATPGGDLLAGVLRYRPLAGEPERNGLLVRIDSGGDVHVLTEEVTWPNGIGVAPDGGQIYLSDYARATVLAIEPDGDGVREFARSPRGSADGLAVDAEGGVWVALGEGAAVARFEPDGKLDEIVPLPARFVSSLSFGGPDMRDVLVSTADNQVRPERGGMILRARSAIAGMPLSPVNV
jgi:sugar lactone lactonase YvrE